MAKILYPSRPWEIDDLLELGKREGEKAQYLKAIPVLILELWVSGNREEGKANFIRTRWAKRRIEDSGLHEPFVKKGSSNILAAISTMQNRRRLEPRLLEYQNPGIALVNLPHYETLLQEYREIYFKDYPDDYRKLYPNPEEEPVWKSEENPPTEESIESIEPEESKIYGDSGMKELSIIQILQEYENNWKMKLDLAEKKVIAVEQENIELKYKLNQIQSELSEIKSTIINTIPSKNRERIPEDVRNEVWNRDHGTCAFPGCGSREKLEYDHIIPVSKGGGNTARNIELLCEKHNRSKRNNI